MLPRSQRGDDPLVAVRAPVGIDMIVVTPEDMRDQQLQSTFGRTVLGKGRRVYAT